MDTNYKIKMYVCTRSKYSENRKDNLQDNRFANLSYVRMSSNLESIVTL